MAFTPEWAPNAHPILVHFPIALLIVAVFADLLALALRRYDWLRPAAVGLYALGAVAAWVAYFSGRAAADTVSFPAGASPTLSEHVRWAEWTIWFYGIFALVRLGVAWWEGHRRIFVHAPLVLLGLVGLFFLYETGEHGAQMVYQHGVGVRAAAREAGTLAPQRGARVLRVEGDGSWTFEAMRGSDTALRRRFDWLEGTFGAFDPAVVADPAEGEVLLLRIAGGRALLVAGPPSEGVRMNLRLNRDAFDGQVALVYGVQDTATYHFAALTGDEVRLGWVKGGATKVDEAAPVRTKGWVTLRAESYGGHFRTYVNDSLVAHAHGPAAPAGRTGLLVEGTGRLMLTRLQVRAIR